jgi:uncharacterized protein (DUF1501 family)
MQELSRRALLLRSGALGCSLAASPLLSPVSLAAGPGENRLVVIVLRGAMDGIDAIRPLHDPSFAARRPGVTDSLTLADGLGLHPALAPLLPLWQAGELAAVQATSTPYRDKRSHFDGQDHLEAGFGSSLPGPVRDGWLNRFLQTLPGGAAREMTYALGNGDMLLTRGAAEVARWAPAADLLMSDHALRLAELVMHDDPLFQSRFVEALAHAGGDGDAVTPADGMEMSDDAMMAPLRGRGNEVDVARFAAGRLLEESRIAAFSLTGWDTHRAQAQNLARALDRLARAVLTLKDGFGPTWGRTTVLAVTEFGRTAVFNGTGGTDHGTGGTLLLAGGALRRAQVAGAWPGLDEADLYARRDILPTSDLRAHMAWALRHGFGAARDDLERSVFPGLEMGPDLGLFA